MEVKALACELPRDLGLPFSRLGRNQVADEAVKRGIVASVSGTNVWRWLNADTIRPWCYRSWIRPRDPDFERKAGLVLDLYHGQWQGKPLGSGDYVISAEEKTSIQARLRVTPTTAPNAGRCGRIEHEYERKVAMAYLAAWDVCRRKVLGLCCERTGIASFRQLVDLVMSAPHINPHNESSGSPTMARPTEEKPLRIGSRTGIRMRCWSTLPSIPVV